MPMTDEYNIRDAEVEEIKEQTILPKKNSKLDFYVELGLILVLGTLVGFAVKTEADKRITIGFNDYKMKIASGQYDINALQAGLLNKKSDSSTSQDPNSGATCTNNDTNGAVNGDVNSN